MKIGVALSGGGTRGIFHIGVLAAIEEMGITPMVISGASAGALVGALYCGGMSPKEILEEARSVKWYHFLGARLPKNGVTNLDYIEGVLRNYLAHDSFELLNIPLHVATTNLQNGNHEIFSSGNLHLPILASCAVPLIFEPVVIESKIYMDGGILMNLPIEPLKPHCDLVIGSNLIPEDTLEENSLKGLTNILTRVLEISINQNTRPQRAMADLIIESSMISKYKRYDFSKPNQLYELGYKTAMSQLPAFIETYKVQNI